MNEMKNLSLTFRLVILILLVFIISSLISISVSMYQTRQSIIELFDTQLYLFAKKLSTSNINLLQQNSYNTDFSNNELKIVDKYISIEDDALTFTIFSIDGEKVYTDGEDSEDFSFNPTVLNTADGFLFKEDKEFKTIWMISKDKKFIVVVAQEKEYVNDLIFDSLENIFYSWFFILPFLFIAPIILIKKELRPLNKLSKDLSLRDAKDRSLLDENTTKELKPVIKALNSLFKKINEMIEKERRFTSNAAHELKTPLTALKVQTEVAKLSLDDEVSLLKSLNNIEIGVNRATRMIEQLLILSRVDSINDFKNLVTINWVELINSTIKEFEFKTKQKDIQIIFIYENSYKTIKGETMMLSLLLKNLLENAINYNHKGTKIKISLQKNNLIIEDNGKGINPEILKNIGERFVRPAGQKQIGSGLGFSIVKQIAKIHNLHLNYENISPNGFKITIFL